MAGRGAGNGSESCRKPRPEVRSRGPKSPQAERRKATHFRNAFRKRLRQCAPRFGTAFRTAGSWRRDQNTCAFRRSAPPVGETASRHQATGIPSPDHNTGRRRLAFARQRRNTRGRAMTDRIDYTPCLKGLYWCNKLVTHILCGSRFSSKCNYKNFG